jgi:hypothetical protein
LSYENFSRRVTELFRLEESAHACCA